ncbi:GntR family transcriptional regulator [Actinomadura sp. KC06]|uniref:FadR/GntR family transcriptional regulator n=1 Tax=Actinomadura sp. KC06 TaxID=2530369 RepID=UPI001404BBCF|nr:GntR family transcriptional regulator [Actinomadura sp. KC06]
MSATHQIREQLLRGIRQGELAPGSALPSERELCEVFGVSRVSVREAIAGLEAMGLVSVRHGRGTFVREGSAARYEDSFGRYLELHRGQLVELLAVRGALDRLAAQQAAVAQQAAAAQQAADAQEGADAREGAAGRPPERVARMVEAHRAFLDAAAEPRPEFDRIAELDVAFHVSVARAGAGGLLTVLLTDLHGLLTESRLITLARPGQASRSVAEHQAIVDAILAGDPAEAGRRSDEHVARVRRWIADFRAPA